jgi:CheY-specific phosphatase CheX
MNNIVETAQQTISRILGEAAFIFTDALDESARPSCNNWDASGVSLIFTGTPSGELRMWVGKGFACFAAANMLGLDEGCDEARQKGLDALKELLNMIVGNFITAAYGEAGVFDLGIPRNLAHEDMAVDFSHPHSFWLEADGNPVLFVIEVDTRESSSA